MALLRVNAGVACSLLVLLAAASLMVAPAHAIQHKCSACKAVGREFYRRLIEEDIADKPDLDLRYGLTLTAIRKGRILPYKESELRATELVDVRGCPEGMRREGKTPSPVFLFVFFSSDKKNK